jgi:hypothetical protein
VLIVPHHPEAVKRQRNLGLIIGQIIYYVTDLKNAPLLDYGGAVTQRNLVLDSEGQPGIRPPTKR